MITPDITRLSPNVNRDAAGNPLPLRARTVIIHCTRSDVSMNPTEMAGTLNYMGRPGTVSSHWVISRLGEAARVVPDDRQAWHAQEDNDNAFGIEVEQGVEADGFTEAQLAKLVEVCRGYVEDFGVPAVHVGSSREPGFIGHQETAQGRRNGKSDPGRLFPWEQFIARLNDGGDMDRETRHQIEDREGRVVRDWLGAMHHNYRLNRQARVLEIIDPATREVVGTMPVPSLPPYMEALT